MGEMFLKKILDKEFETLTADELKVIAAHDTVFPISKKNKKTLEKIIEDGITASNKDEMVAVLKEGLPNPFAILSSLDKHSLVEGEVKLEFRKNLIENLNQMNHLQLGIFIDKVLMISDESKIRFFRNEEYSLHEINVVISKSLGLTLAFEVFKKGDYKTFLKVERIRRQFLKRDYKNII